MGLSLVRSSLFKGIHNILALNNLAEDDACCPGSCYSQIDEELAAAVFGPALAMEMV